MFSPIEIALISIGSCLSLLVLSVIFLSLRRCVNARSSDKAVEVEHKESESVTGGESVQAPSTPSILLMDDGVSIEARQ